MFCCKCGQKLLEEALYCSNCGNRTDYNFQNSAVISEKNDSKPSISFQATTHNLEKHVKSTNLPPQYCL